MDSTSHPTQDTIAIPVQIAKLGEQVAALDRSVQADKVASKERAHA